MQDLNNSFYHRTAIVKAQAAKRKRNTLLATILINSVGAIIGALCVIYATTVAFN